jgi:hypothetical protein
MPRLCLVASVERRVELSTSLQHLNRHQQVTAQGTFVFEPSFGWIEIGKGIGTRTLFCFENSYNIT